MSKKIKTGILGATGLVGQYLISLLEEHPWFEVTELAASEKSVGKTFGETCIWRISRPMPESVKRMTMKSASPADNFSADVVFSSMPSDVAGKIEIQFALTGYPVISNSSSHRMDDDVPLIIPEVNPDHSALIPIQKRNRKWNGFIITNPNCTTIGLTLALTPLKKQFGVELVQVTSYQALSGAGSAGVVSLDIIDNVIPFIKNEELKVESEPLKLLGMVQNDKIELAPFRVSAHCSRVNVSHGHLLAVSVKLKRKPSVDEFISAFSSFISPIQSLNLPSAPLKPIIIKGETDRPQPKFDRNTDNGMAISIGRIRPCPVFDYKFFTVSHNMIRGAAGASILNAELLKAQGYL